MNALLLALLLAMSVTFTGCGDDDEDAGATAGFNEATEEDEADLQYEDADEEESGGLVEKVVPSDEALTGEGFTQLFIGEKFYDGKVENEEDALRVMNELLEYLGGYDNVVLEGSDTHETADWVTYYAFRQLADDIEVYGASAKLAVDKDNVPIGVNSTLIPGLNISGDVKWSIDDKEAEAIVKEVMKETFADSGNIPEIIPNTTEKTLLPMFDGARSRMYVWVVYTDNPYSDVDTAYLANYVASDGEYVSSVPVRSPGNSDAKSGAAASFTFDKLEPDTWTGTVTKYHGETEEITVPVAKDPETGDILLADVERKIIAADYADYTYNDTYTFRKEENGRFADNELLIYRGMIEIYDFYKGTGWEGASGDNEPILLLMDWVTEDGVPVDNACYSGTERGFDKFCFNRNDPDGETYDIMAHEFTHAVTGKNLGGNSVYRNDYGAIDESMSDIMGNIIEAYLGKTEDKTWLISENGIKPERCMSDPHIYNQPAFVWDKFFVPAVESSKKYNDNGGVHTNSSLLNLIGYRLNEAGMSLEDQFYYWMNVSLMLTPRTDYEQIADVLPWSLRVSGFEQYMDVLNGAIDEVKIADTSLPDDVPDGLAQFRVQFPDHDVLDKYDVLVVITDAESNEIYSWPQQGTDLIVANVDPGYYIFEIQLRDDETDETVTDFVSESGGWTRLDGEVVTGDNLKQEYYTYIDAGQIMELDADSLGELMAE